jgi:hypothetical protein
VAAGYRLTVRVGPRVERSDHATLDAAVDALAARLGRERPARRPARVFAREIAPERQVVARGELAGPGRARGGIDLRGDGSSEAWTGRWRRTVVPPTSGEDPVAALRRALAHAGASQAP